MAQGQGIYYTHLKVYIVYYNVARRQDQSQRFPTSAHKTKPLFTKKRKKNYNFRRVIYSVGFPRVCALIRTTLHITSYI